MNFSTCSLQSLFNYVSKHLVRQNSRTPYRCYDSKTERRCAFGCLLPLSFYRTWGNVGFYEIYEITGISRDCTKSHLMRKLMSCHDNLKPSKWKARLCRIAREANLVVPDFLKSAKPKESE